jgi:hypothetical protein
MSKEKITTTKTLIKEATLPINYHGKFYLDWFLGDVSNLQLFASKLFDQSINLNDSNWLQYKIGAEKALTEIEDDVVNIRRLLDEYN